MASAAESRGKQGMILHWIHQFPDVVDLAVAFFVLAAAAAAAPFVGARLLRNHKHESWDEAAFDGFKAVMATTSIVLAFSLVQANANLQTVEARVAKEGAALLTTDRALQRLGRADAAALRVDLDDFARKQATLEWPLLADGQRSPEVDDAFTKVSRGARAIDPDGKRQEAMFTELLKSIDDLSDARESILAEETLELPPLFWITTLSLLAIALALAGLTRASQPRVVSLAATSGAVALLLAFVAVVDQPFSGQTSVSPQGILTAADLNKHRL